MTARRQAPHIVLVVVNIPVRRDRRVTREAMSLVAAGYQVTVVCPDDGETASVPGCPEAAVVTFAKPIEGIGPLTFLLEFMVCLVQVARTLQKLRRRGPLAGVQFCNPPDVFAPVAWALRLRGVRVVFDHHDLSPEIFLARGGRPGSLLHRVLLLLERSALRTADAVVSCNESFRDIACSRAGVDAARVFVVRNGPNLAELPSPNGSSDSRAHDTEVVYVGVLGRQDGVDSFVEMARLVCDTEPGTRHVVVGDGEMMPQLRRQAADLGLGECLRFTGWLSADQVHAQLARSSVAVQPDPYNDMNNLSTMAKTVEYLAHGLPVVAVDLVETRRSAGDAARYVADNDPAQLAGAVLELLADSESREAMAATGRARVQEYLAWDHQAKGYLRMWRSLLGPIP